MLTADQQFVLGLLRTSLSDAEDPVVSHELNMSAIALAIRRNGILPTVYPSLGVFPDLQHTLQMEYYASVSQSVNQRHSGQKVLEAFGASGVQCVPLKGWEMRSLYPNPEMRQMTDMNVLVRPYEHDAIEGVMRSLAFAAEGEESSDKHDVYRKGTVTVEVHKRLTDDWDAIRDWETRMWNRVTVDSHGYYHMSDEDVYLFHFVHMHHDFGNGWFGLRRIVDAWLLNKQWNQLDTGYVMQVLDSMRLNVFHTKMV
ncbi:MAG: nucleotidyltransferase family protein [Atopobiaceae bacterium]|nr:nucleotidyltransferase family protein [Atopobiaceae bacterium]